MAVPDPNWTNLFGYRTPISEWTGIVAIFVSGYAAITIKSVRSQILGRVRLPKLFADIEGDARNIVGLMREYEANREQISLEIIRCEAHLKVLLVSIKGQTKGTIRNLQKHINKYRGRSIWCWVAARNTRQDAWRIYELMNGLIEELKHILDDQRVGG